MYHNFISFRYYFYLRLVADTPATTLIADFFALLCYYIQYNRIYYYLLMANSYRN